ncbi:hypothetical protein DPMN_087211 [Dreissena polymorpha]|uniref:Uncharacterized protein n=1 Tax=Dreissena polymorpha TaxID=45954 RepID=A0A9D4KSD4_DREPO|nr:hypothetical protein DPMN_087211 [Dreissena polymorpha]
MNGEEQKNKEEERYMKGKEEQKKNKEEMIKDIDGDKSTNRGKKRKNEQADILEKKKNKPCTTDEEMKSLDNARAKLQELSNRARTLIAETVESSSFVNDGYLYEIKTVSRKYKL